MWKSGKPSARIARTESPPHVGSCRDDDRWPVDPTLYVRRFRPERTSHRPVTEVRLLYDDMALYGLFCVQDRYVRCVREGLQVPVCRDSCVELFVQPGGRGGYFNFEFNCGGAALASYITDQRRTPDGFADFARLSVAECRRIELGHTLDGPIDPEIEHPLDWALACRIPFGLIESYSGVPPPRPGVVWRGNAYKCGDETSHPHWAAWSPVPELNFHDPQAFGDLLFD